MEIAYGILLFQIVNYLEPESVLVLECFSTEIQRKIHSNLLAFKRILRNACVEPATSFEYCKSSMKQFLKPYVGPYLPFLKSFLPVFTKPAVLNAFNVSNYQILEFPGSAIDSIVAVFSSKAWASIDHDHFVFTISGSARVAITLEAQVSAGTVKEVRLKSPECSRLVLVSFCRKVYAFGGYIRKETMGAQIKEYSRTGSVYFNSKWSSGVQLPRPAQFDVSTVHRAKFYLKEHKQLTLFVFTPINETYQCIDIISYGEIQNIFSTRQHLILIGKSLAMIKVDSKMDEISTHKIKNRGKFWYGNYAMSRENESFFVFSEKGQVTKFNSRFKQFILLLKFY